MKLKDWLVPREGRFFDLLEEQSSIVLEGTEALASALHDGRDAHETRRRLKEIEHRGDLVVHSVFEALNQSMITPIDREDIARLTSSLDTVLDHTYAVALRFDMYEVRKPTKELVSLAEVLRDQVRFLDEALRHLREPSERGKVRAKLVEVHALENRADEIANTAVAALFHQDDLKFLLKMKEIYEYAESATDKCEDAADVIRDVLVKHA